MYPNIEYILSVVGNERGLHFSTSFTVSIYHKMGLTLDRGEGLRFKENFKEYTRYQEFTNLQWKAAIAAIERTKFHKCKCIYMFWAFQPIIAYILNTVTNGVCVENTQESNFTEMVIREILMLSSGASVSSSLGASSGASVSSSSGASVSSSLGASSGASVSSSSGASLRSYRLELLRNLEIMLRSGEMTPLGVVSDLDSTENLETDYRYLVALFAIHSYVSRSSGIYVDTTRTRLAEILSNPALGQEGDAGIREYNSWCENVITALRKEDADLLSILTRSSTVTPPPAIEITNSDIAGLITNSSSLPY